MAQLQTHSLGTSGYKFYGYKELANNNKSVLRSLFKLRIYP